MKIQIFKPQNDKLKRHIDKFYILEQEASNETVSYLSFPNPYSIISSFEKVRLKRSPNRMHFDYNPNGPLISDLTLSYKKPILISYKGTIKEISICFNPLGIHSFFSDIQKQSPYITSYVPYPEFEQEMAEVLHCSDANKLISQLECFLLTKLSNFTHPFLFEFVDDISNSSDFSISYLANKYEVSKKTLIKHSKKYLNRTPSEFKKVIRFRKAINEHLFSENEFKSLTEISNTVSFFDQAHMIKDFKAMTGYAPRSFFNRIESSYGKFIWIYL